MRTRTSTTVLALLFVAAAGCKTAPVPKTAEAKNENGKTAATSITWLHDGWNAALEAAKKANKPLVIDVWAPWCHTCLSMKHYVLSDPAMAVFSDRFIWLALDTDREESAPFLEKFPVHAWPTFFVVSPVDESIQARFQGAASISQFKEFLKQGEAGHLDARAEKGKLADSDPLFSVRKGDRLAVSGDIAGAGAAYREALDRAPIGWSRRPDVLVSLMGVLAEGERWSDCADLSLEAAQQTGSAASATDFTYYSSFCASMLVQGDPRRKDIYELSVKRLTTIADDPNAPLSVDDRSDALKALREALEALGDKKAAQVAAEKQLELLNDAAARAPSPEAASTYNWPRAEVHVYLNRGGEIIEALRASMDALPDDYDPPYRLAWVALQIGALDLAMEAANRALELAYGPRKGNVLELTAKILKARGDVAKQKETLKTAIDLYQSLPQGQKQPDALKRVEEALKEQ